MNSDENNTIDIYRFYPGNVGPVSGWFCKKCKSSSLVRDESMTDNNSLAVRYKAFIEKWNIPPETSGDLQEAIMDWLIKTSDLNPCIEPYRKDKREPRYLCAETVEAIERMRRNR